MLRWPAQQVTFQLRRDQVKSYNGGQSKSTRAWNCRPRADIAEHHCNVSDKVSSQKVPIKTDIRTQEFPGLNALDVVRWRWARKRLILTM